MATAVATGSPPAAPDTSPAPGTPAHQVAAHLVPLRRGPDGTHRLTAHLYPEDLGQITVIAEVRRGEITVHLAGSTEAGRLALAAGLPELRKDLVDSGFGSCSLNLLPDASYDLAGQRQGLADNAAPDHRQAPEQRSSDGQQPDQRRPAVSDQVLAPHPSKTDRTTGRGVDIHV